MKTFRTIFMISMLMLMVLSLSAFQMAEEGLPMIQIPMRIRRPEMTV